MKDLRKKGSISDLPYIIGGIFSFAIIVFLVTYLTGSINDRIQDIDTFDANAKAKSQQMTDDFPKVVDGGTVLLFFLLCFVSFVFAALIPVHPVFVVFYILEWLLLIWIGGGIANAYQMFYENPVFADTATKFTLQMNLFRYLPFIVGVIGAILAVIMYKTKKAMTGE